MSKAIRIHQYGTPDIMVWEDVPLATPGPGEALIRHTAIGVNYIDTYYRSGIYPLSLPSILGSEAAGIVEAIGPGVTEVKKGDRVAYGGNAPIGSYAEKRLLPADKLVLLPTTITDQQAASIMLKGLTAQYLVRKTYAVKAGDILLCHAAAGGVGLLLGQWAKHLGATVIGTVGTRDKERLARAHGYDHIILYREIDFASEVMKLTNNKGVSVVYDGVGQDTFLKSLDCLQPRGLMVSFGNASGAVAPFPISLLSQKGSLYLTRPTLATYIGQRADLLQAAAELFDMVSAQHITINVNQSYAFKRCSAGSQRFGSPRHNWINNPYSVNLFWLYDQAILVDTCLAFFVD